MDEGAITFYDLWGQYHHTDITSAGVIQSQHEHISLVSSVDRCGDGNPILNFFETDLFFSEKSGDEKNNKTCVGYDYGHETS